MPECATLPGPHDDEGTAPLLPRSAATADRILSTEALVLLDGATVLSATRASGLPVRTYYGHRARRSPEYAEAQRRLAELCADADLQAAARARLLQILRQGPDHVAGYVGLRLLALSPAQQSPQVRLVVESFGPDDQGGGAADHAHRTPDRDPTPDPSPRDTPER